MMEEPLNDSRVTLQQFCDIAGISPGASWQDVVRWVQQLPYARTSQAGARGVLLEGRGTCSGKHYLIAEVLRDGWPQLRVAIVHRVYSLGRLDAEAMFGPGAAQHVPEAGLVDVHTYLVVHPDPHEEPILVDATFPRDEPWDGATPMTLACGEGADHPAGEDPVGLKAALVSSYCDPRLREPFIRSLSSN